MPSPSRRVSRWRSEGDLRAVGSQQIFVRRQAGNRPLLLLLHGFPSSSFDWRHLLPHLAGRSVLTFDFLGFGLSAKPRNVIYSLMRQADIVERLLEGVEKPVIVIGHDMGTSVTTELLARDIEGGLSFKLAGAMLFNGSIIIERASLTMAQKALRSRFGPLVSALSHRRAFQRQFARLFSSRHPLDPEEAEDQWWLWQRDGGHRIAHRLVHYLGERVSQAGRWHGAIRDGPGPLFLTWGLQDPVATPKVLEGVRELRPQAPVKELRDLGHYPQIEAPERIAEAIDELLVQFPAGRT